MTNYISHSSIRFVQFIPAIVWFILLDILLFMPGQKFPTVGDWFHVFNVDKIIHISLFTGLGVLFSRPVVKSSYTSTEKFNYCIKIAVAGCLWGITSEFIQKYYIPNRSFELLDWAADSIGVSIALAYSLRMLKKSRS